MSDLFDSLKNIKFVHKKHFVTIQGKKVEVTLKEKLDIIQFGEKNYVLKDDKPFRKQVKSNRNKFAEIERFTSDPFWPTEELVWKK